MIRSLAYTAILCTMVLQTTALSAEQRAKAEIRDLKGQVLGILQLIESEGPLQIDGKLRGLKPGEHGFHIHETGKCEPPFKSAGGHFNPANVKHGFSSDGPHAGDLTNLTVESDGSATIDRDNERVTLKKGEANSLFDGDGSAFIVHARADDYESQPSGNAGKRIACGVIE